jgi:signal transduction histidine kinase
MNMKKINSQSIKYVSGAVLGVISALILIKVLLGNSRTSELLVPELFKNHMEALCLVLLLLASFAAIGVLITHIHTLNGKIKIREQAFEIIEKKESIKSKFLAYAAHNLRTPATALRWSLGDFIKSETSTLNADQRNILNSMYSVSLTILITIENFLTVSKMELKKMEITYASITLEKFAKEISQSAGNLMALANDKKISLTVNSKIEENAPFDVDLAQVNLAVNNLLENALTYTLPNGKVEIDITNDVDNVYVSIKDDGIGIPESEQKDIFGEFFRSTNAKKLKSTGDGIGLYIAKAVVEAHDGTLTFTSKENEGSTFTLKIPLQRSEKREVVKAFSKI